MIPELLAPAGSPEALLAAAAAGADAVYFGGNAFSNRMRARNFDNSELTEALAQCRLWRIRTYATINTRVTDGEMDAVLSLAELLCRGGVTGFIVADCGIARELHRRYPTVPLHASTQMTLMTRADMEALAPYGFTRIVLPREISLPEAAALAQAGPLETELFCHGAHCVSVSGQCLMSYVMGGRSGNRGECAQPCRMTYRCSRIGTDSPENREKLREILAMPTAKSRDPHLERYPEAIENSAPPIRQSLIRPEQTDIRSKTFSAPPRAEIPKNRQNRRTDRTARSRPEECRPAGSLRDSFPLSLRDMCLAAWIPEITASGITSLKIEGRQKSAAYVYGVTRIYRTLLDENRRASADEIAALDSLFSREGFTDAYFANTPGKAHPYVSMCGIRPPLGESGPDASTKYDVSCRLLPVTGRFTAITGEKMTLTLSCCQKTVAVSGDVVQAAATAPLTADVVCRNLTKTGGTAFTFAGNTPQIALSPDAWVPVSAINALRRAAIDRLTDTVLPKPAYVRVDAGEEVLHLPQFETGEKYAVITRREQLTARAARYFDRIFLPAADYLSADGTLPAHCGADLPPVCFSDAVLADTLDTLCARGCRAVRIHAPGQLLLARQHGLYTLGSLRLNVWNTAAAQFWYDSGLDRLTASPEATVAMLRRFRGSAGAVVYGRLPLMRTERCFLAGTGDRPACPGCGGRSLPQMDCPVDHPVDRPSAAPAHLCPADGCLGILTDRMQMRFPVIARNGECELENAAPLQMADRMHTLPPLSHGVFLFTIETPEEVDGVIADYENGTARQGRRLR